MIVRRAERAAARSLASDGFRPRFQAYAVYEAVGNYKAEALAGYRLAVAAFRANLTAPKEG